MEELEARHSDLHREMVAAKEAVSQVTLQKEVLEDEKRSLAAALSKVAGLKGCKLGPWSCWVRCLKGVATAQCWPLLQQRGVD